MYKYVTQCSNSRGRHRRQQSSRKQPYTTCDIDVRQNDWRQGKVHKETWRNTIRGTRDESYLFSVADIYLAKLKTSANLV